MQAITAFSGKNSFLSNFYPAEVNIFDLSFPTAEHAFVAAKTDCQETREFISTIETPGKAKRYGRKMRLREHWEILKVTEMSAILTLKFHGNEDAGDKLIATGDAQLIEGNRWNDRFWGQCPIGTGENMLGILLMVVRSNLVAAGAFAGDKDMQNAMDIF